MVSNRRKNESIGAGLSDRTEEVKRAFLTTCQHEAKERSSFLEETKDAGVMSVSGKWLVLNAAEGVIAQAPAQEGGARDDARNEDCLCPECVCPIHGTPHDTEHDGLQKNWQDIKQNQTGGSRTSRDTKTPISRPSDTFTP